MPSEIKRTIQDVRVTQKGVKILLGKEELLLSVNDYASGFYYPDKVLTEEEYQELRQLSSRKKASDQVSSLLSRSRYSLQGIKDKVRKRYPLSDKEMEALLLPYIESGILDDVSYALDYAELKSSAGYGRFYIENELKKKGIPQDVLKNPDLLPFYEESRKNLPQWIEKKEKTMKNQTIEKRKASLLAFLIRRGYSSSESKKAIEEYYHHLSPESREEEEQNRKVLLKKEAEKCYNALVRKNLPSLKKKEQYYQKLRMKGFRYDEIEELTEKEGYQFHD